MHCKNCGNIVHQKYCPHCGQKATVERITFHFLWHQLFHFFTHLEKGFLFTSYGMLLRPGKTVTDFIRGKRIIYQPPVSYFLVWIAIYALMLYCIREVFGEGVVIAYRNYFGSEVSTQYAINHLGIVLSILLPLFAFYIYLITSARLFNYAESLVTVLYALGTIILAQSLFAVLSVLGYLVTKNSFDLQVSDAFKVIYLSWFGFSFMKQLPLKHKFLRAVLFTVLCFGSFTLWRLMIYPQVSQWFLNTH
jgi:hypothetical protein